MAGVSGSEFLQIGIFAGVIGLAFFCLSYAVLVWNRRNASVARFGPLRRIALAVFVIGVSAAGSILGMSALTRREGVVDGSDLFVVHARSDAVVRLTDASRVENGAELASFEPAGQRNRREILELQSARAAAARDAIKARPIALDQALLNEQAQLRSLIADQERNRLDLERSARDLEKARSALLLGWTRERKELEAAIATAEISANAARDLGRLAKSSLDRVTEGRQRELIPIPELEKRRASIVEVEANRQKEQGAQDLLRRRLSEIEGTYRDSDEQLARQLALVERQAAELTGRIGRSEAQLDDVTARLAADRERAAHAHAIDIAAAELQANLTAAEARRVVDADRVQAPFGGQVVYRHPAPALARDGAPILALAPGSGFIARVPLARDEADELMAQKGDVTMALNQPVLSRLFTARIKTIEPMASESDRVLGVFEANLPPELLTYLSQPGHPVRFQLLWRPDVLQDPHMRVALLVAFAGLVGFFVVGRADRTAARRPSLPASLAPDQRPAVVRGWQEPLRPVAGRPHAANEGGVARRAVASAAP